MLTATGYNQFFVSPVKSKNVDWSLLAQHSRICIRIQVAHPGHNISGQQVSRCKRGFSRRAINCRASGVACIVWCTCLCCCCWCYWCSSSCCCCKSAYRLLTSGYALSYLSGAFEITTTSLGPSVKNNTGWVQFVTLVVRYSEANFSSSSARFNCFLIAVSIIAFAYG